MCSWSGRICSAKRPSKVMMVSKAREPQITADIENLGGIGIESKQPVAGDRGRWRPSGATASAMEPDHSEPAAMTPGWVPSSAGISTRRTTAWSCASVSVSSNAGIATSVLAWFFKVTLRR